MWLVAGKGELAVHVADCLHAHGCLLGVVPCFPIDSSLPDLETWAISSGVRIYGGGLIPKEVAADYLISVFYNRILRREELDRFRNCFNIHNSFLPYYRGVRSINWALKNCERQHGITLHKMDEGIDSGQIVCQVSYPLWPDLDEVGDVYSRASGYGKLLWDDFFTGFPNSLEGAWTPYETGSYYDSTQNRFLGDRSGMRRQ